MSDGHMGYNAPFTNEQWVEIKARWEHRRVWGIKVTNLADVAGTAREPRLWPLRWVVDHDLAPLATFGAVVLAFCVIVITVSYVVLT